MHDVNKEEQRLIVDPPSGWKYGFPKPYFKNAITNKDELNKWLIENGYPQKEIDSLGKHMYVRCWTDRV